MDRLVRLAVLWDRLPVFRAVAETEHVHRAAKRLDTSASAISRTIRLLEEGVGAPLFRRVGRTLKLTELGRELLDATRIAMRTVDGALPQAGPNAIDAPLRIGTTNRETRLLAALAIARLSSDAPRVVPQVTTVSTDEIGPALLRGDLDLALTPHAMAQRSLEVHRIGTLSYGLYCSADRKGARDQDDADRAFVAPIGTRWADGWPPDIRRLIAVHTEEVEDAITIAARTSLVVVLADALVQTASVPLQRVGKNVVPASTVFAVHRAPLTQKPPPETRFLEEVRAVMKELPQG